MIQLIVAAFTIGIVGSFHCVGMCGPLAMSLPLQAQQGPKLIGAMLYNFGRIITYSLFGLLFGIIGQSVALFGFQQWLSVIAGCIILLFVILPKYITKNNSTTVLRFFEKIRTALGNLFFKKSQSSLFVIGLLNGLLPCGLVYMAIAGSIATGDVLYSILFMAFFGLGTLPVMLLVSYFGNFVGVTFRQKIIRAYPFMMILMACLLILRGIGLGIPYVSPVMAKKAMTVHGCCQKP